MSITDSPGAGFKSLLQQRTADFESQNANVSGQKMDTTDLGLLSTRAYYRQATPSEPQSLTDRVQLPPHLKSALSFAPGDRVNRISTPPSDTTAPAQAKLETLRPGEVTTAPADQVNRVRLRAARSDEVSPFVRNQDYLAFFDSSKCRLEHNFDLNGTKVTQMDTQSFRTRTLESKTNGDKVETVRCPAGKPLFTKVTERGGDWEIQEMSYATNPATGREGFNLAQKRVANSRGEDKLITYDKGRVVTESTKPLELIPRLV